ncbi:MAG: polysaccharide deacetylase family protein [Candidatus Sungbacteria bacterium]|nr:polysaccharide deacetylase family protein [Candidatus Sungbacteria bacterium]
MKSFLRKLLTLKLWILQAALRPFFSQPVVAVLVYHSVDDTNWFYGVSPGAFRQQMEYLKRYCRPVTFQEVVSYAKGEIKLSPRSVAVTFDDGYANVVEAAFPVLRDYGIPMTIFLTTSPEANRKELDNSFPIASWDQIRDMARSGLVTVGAHGATHVRLDTIPPELLEREIYESQRTIEKELDGPPKFFAYPKGLFSKEVVEAVKRHGFEAAAAAKQGIVRPGDDPYAIKRVAVHRGIGEWEFKARLTAAIDWITYWWVLYQRLISR